VLEQGLHADAEVLVVAVDGGPDRGFAANAGAADPGEDGCDDVVAQDEEGGDGPGGLQDAAKSPSCSMKQL
jgi:hypothetical protein